MINEKEEYSLQIKGNYYFKSGNEILDYDVVDETNHKVQLKNSNGQSVYPATLVDGLQKIDNVCHEKLIYDTSYGEKSWYELFRIPSTSNWAAVTVSFELIGFNHLSYTRACLETYNNGSYGFTYLENKGGDTTLYYNINSDNTVSVYCYVDRMYSPKVLKVLSYYNNYRDYNYNIFEGGYPKVISEPANKTLFSSW